MYWNYLLLFFASCIVLRFVINFYKYSRIKTLYDKYLDYLRTDNLTFVQHKREIIELLKEAGLEDFAIMHQEFMGFGQFANMRISGFDNLTNRQVNIVQNMQMRFNEAIGVYRRRYLQSFNPLFWIEYIVKLPQYLFEFFGVLPEKIVVKVFLVIYWLLALLLGLKQFNLLEHLVK